jgi:predicted NBD/HSP70 family sugar kinase
MYYAEKGLSLSAIQPFNRSVILTAIHELGTCSRKEISVKTGLDQATVTRAIGQLIDIGIVEEVGLVAGVRGRRAINLSLSSQRFRIIAVRLKRLSFSTALFDLLGQAEETAEVPIPAGQEPERTFEQIAELVDSYHRRKDTEIVGIGVALPGPFLESDERIILMTESPEWQAFDFVHELRLRYPETPIFSSHDAKAAALAVWREVAMELRSSVMLYVMLGQGVGSALVINNQVFKGSHGFAGELGHTSIDINGPACKCGNRGCLELYTSTLAIVRKVREGVRNGRETSLKANASFDDVVRAYHAGDNLALTEVDHVAECIAQSLISCVNLINPDLIVLGEEAVAFGERFLGIVDAKLEAGILPSIYGGIAVRMFGTEGDIALNGSFLNVLQQTVLTKSDEGWARASAR